MDELLSNAESLVIKTLQLKKKKDNNWRPKSYGWLASNQVEPNRYKKGQQLSTNPNLDNTEQCGISRPVLEYHTQIASLFKSFLFSWLVNEKKNKEKYGRRD